MSPHTPLTPHKVSIIVRSMDRPSLAATLDSIAHQTHPDIEVLVVAACGADHRPLSEFRGDRDIRLVSQHRPLHRSEAANCGLEAASGPFLMFLDDDDTIDPDHVARLVETLAPTSDSVCAVHTGVRVLGCTGEHAGFATPFNRFAMLASNSIPIHAVLFKQAVVTQGARFDPQFDRYEDWDFWLQLSEQGDFIYLPGTSATYYQHTANSGTAEDLPFFSKDFQAIYAKWWPRLQPNARAQLMHHIWESHQKMDIFEREKREFLTTLDELKLRQEDHQKASLALQTLLEKTQGELAEEKSRMQDAVRQCETTQQEIQALNHTLQQVLQSRSWKVTAPLRAVAAKVLLINRLWSRLVLIAPHHGGWISLGRKGLRYIKSNGWRHTLNRLRYTGTASPKVMHLDYDHWVQLHDIPTPKDDVASILARMPHPLVSIVMPTYNSKPVWLRAAVESIQKQSYPHWELCISDDASPSAETRRCLEDLAKEDPRIKVHYRKVNGHISASSNDALALASGSYVALVDHDDLLHPDALLHVAQAIHRHPKAGIIYSDEDKVSADGSQRYAPYFKSDWNRDLFLSHNLISHLGIYKTDLLRSIGGFRVGLEGSQDHDLALRAIEQLDDSQIVHIPKVLYHWRSHEESTASSGNAKSYAIQAGVRAIQEHLNRTGVRATASIDPTTGSHYRVRYELPEKVPMVSLILPSRDAAHLISTCVSSLLTETDYPNFELIFVDNNTQEPDALKAIEQLALDPRVKVVRDPRPFNYSALCNFGVQHARGEVLALVNNDVEVISKDWLQEMVSIALQPGVGAVGARLWYPNDTLQHGGVILGFGGVANHAHLGLPRGVPGYFGRAMTLQSFSAVTGACLVVKRAIYEEVKGLDEINLPVAFNDVDFCIRIKMAGYRNVWTPYAELYHHESATRGADLSPEKRARFEREVNYMQDQWNFLLKADPCYNPNLALSGEFFSLSFPPRPSA
jgi:glycosyltransferase involved in cell wall biosynthesis